jgi:hypothetical protein
VGVSEGTKNAAKKKSWKLSGIKRKLASFLGGQPLYSAVGDARSRIILVHLEPEPQS